MTRRGKTFVGFGFGPIQSALFLYEAHCSGNFARYVIAEVDAGLVGAVRADGGRYTINIAHPDRIEHVVVDGVRLYDPTRHPDRDEFVRAIAARMKWPPRCPACASTTRATRRAWRDCSPTASRGTDPSNRSIIYTAENHNHAAEILSERLIAKSAPLRLANTQTLNTVIGKMSGVITDADTIRRLGLAPLTPDTPRAVLVERFNRILISRVTLEGFHRGIDVFVEKDDLLPFEEAKLYGHNAIHALIGYLARLRGLTTMAEAACHADIMATARAAFIDESAAALVKKHDRIHDPLFTVNGYRDYADDLIRAHGQSTLERLDLSRHARRPAQARLR